MSEAGRPSELTEELTLKIREMVLSATEYKVIQETLEIPAGTWDYWVYKNYQGFRDDLIRWKKERMVKKAEKTIEALIESEDDRVRLDASKFVASTLGKIDYSTRTEMTGAEGKPIVFIPSEIAQKNDINTSSEPNS